jgi:hypothetical protein
MVAAVAAGIAIAAVTVVWPRLALMFVGLVSLLLGLLALSAANAVSIPALSAILGGVALIGFGRLVGILEALLHETRSRGVGRPGGAKTDRNKREPVEPDVRREQGRVANRIEPRL